MTYRNTTPNYNDLFIRSQPWLPNPNLPVDPYSYLQQSQGASNTISGGFDMLGQQSNAWSDGGLQIIAPELAGITSTHSSFMATYNDRGTAPSTFERGHFSSSSYPTARSPRADMNAFSGSGSVDYMPSAYSRDELYPFSPKPASWPSVPPSTPGGFGTAKSPKHQQPRNTIPPDGFIYQVQLFCIFLCFPSSNLFYHMQVQFKRAHKNYILAPSAPRDIIPGDFVKVEADRGEDMGIVLAKIPVEDFEEVIPTAGYRGRGFSSGQGEKKYLFRLATPDERASLTSKVQEEERALEVSPTQNDFLNDYFHILIYRLFEKRCWRKDIPCKC
jgi:hypothetical protein